MIVAASRTGCSTAASPAVSPDVRHVSIADAWLVVPQRCQVLASALEAPSRISAAAAQGSRKRGQLLRARP